MYIIMHCMFNVYDERHVNMGFLEWKDISVLYIYSIIVLPYDIIIIIMVLIYLLLHSIHMHFIDLLFNKEWYYVIYIII